MKIRDLKHFNKIKKKYSGFNCDVYMKDGHGENVTGVIAPLELESHALGYLGFLRENKDFLFIIRPEGKLTYLCATVINRIDVNTSRKVKH